MITYSMNGNAYVDFFGVRQIIQIPKSTLIKLLSENDASILKHIYKSHKLYLLSDILHLDSNRQVLKGISEANLPGSDKKELSTTYDN